MRSNSGLVSLKNDSTAKAQCASYQAMIVSENNSKTSAEYRNHSHLPRFTCATPGNSLKRGMYFCGTLYIPPRRKSLKCNSTGKTIWCQSSMLHYETLTDGLSGISIELEIDLMPCPSFVKYLAFLSLVGDPILTLHIGIRSFHMLFMYVRYLHIPVLKI